MKFTLGFLWMLWHSLWILSGFGWFGVQKCYKKLKQKTVAVATRLGEKMKSLNWIKWGLYVSTVVLVIISLALFAIGKTSLAILAIEIPALMWVTHLAARVFLPLLGEIDTLFSGPKLGRIKARRRGGRAVLFFDNVVERTSTGKHWKVDGDTGQMIEAVTHDLGNLWRTYGVIWLGLDDTYRYQIVTEANEQLNGDLKFNDPVWASSIYFHGTYTLVSYPFTKDGVRFKVKIQIKTRTTNAATALSLPQSWTIPMFQAILAIISDFFRASTAEEMISRRHEAGEIKGEKPVIKDGKVISSSSKFVAYVMTLNKDTSRKGGNIALSDICGQFIESVTIADIDFATKEDADQFMAPFRATREKQAQVIESEGNLAASINNSQAEENLLTGRANGLTKIVKAFGGDTGSAAEVEVAHSREKMTNLHYLAESRGGQGAPPAGIILPELPTNKKEKK